MYMKNSPLQPDNFSGFDHSFADSILALMITDLKFMQEYHERLKPELFVDDIRIRFAELALKHFQEYNNVAQNLFFDYVDKIADQENFGEARTRLIKDKAVGVMQSSCDAKYVAERLDDFFDFQKVKMLRHEIERACENADLVRAIDSIKKVQFFQDTKQQTSTLYPAAEAFKPQPAIEWIVDSLISAGSVSVVVGDPGSKKTYLCLDMGVCVAMGIEWLGFRAKKFNVLIIDEESGHTRLTLRLSKVLRGHGASENLPLFYTSFQAFDLRNEADIQRLRLLVKNIGAQLVILDALADLMPGGDENSVKDTQPVFQALRSIAESEGCAFVVIHHTNKEGKYRGSSAIKAAVDCLYKIKSEYDSNEIKFSCEKSRDSMVKPFEATAHFEPLQFWLSASTANFKALANFNKSEKAVLQFLMNQPENKALFTDIKKGVKKLSGKDVEHGLYSLKNRGFVNRMDQGGKGTPALYQVVASRKEEIDVFNF
jgi:hypothetical protein